MKIKFVRIPVTVMDIYVIGAFTFFGVMLGRWIEKNKK